MINLTFSFTFSKCIVPLVLSAMSIMEYLQLILSFFKTHIAKSSCTVSILLLLLLLEKTSFRRTTPTTVITTTIMRTTTPLAIPAINLLSSSFNSIVSGNWSATLFSVIGGNNHAMQKKRVRERQNISITQ